MPTRSASAKWEGGLKTGRGTYSGANGLGGQYNFSSRFEIGPGSNPEELIAAAHAACYSMALSGGAREEWNAADERLDDGEVHGREGQRANDDHADATRRRRRGSEHRRRDVSEDRGGEQGRLPGVASAQRQRRHSAQREASVGRSISRADVKAEGRRLPRRDF